MSPDPAGRTAANPADPQSWNRYAYVANRPLSSVDPLGLDCALQSVDLGTDIPCGGGDGYCPPEYEYCGDDPFPPPDLGGGGGGSGTGGGGVGNGSTHPDQPQRKGGVWANNETLGLPKGLNLRPASLLDLLGLSPGTQCDLGVCTPVGNDMAQAAAAPWIVPCLSNPVCATGLAVLTIYTAYEAYKIYKQTQTQTQTQTEEERCKAVREECLEQCWEAVHDMPVLPQDRPGLLRKCTRKCMNDQGCFNY